MSPEKPADPRSTSELVIEALAEHADVDPLELDVPLGEVIDPDALDSLFTSPLGNARHAGTIEFSYQNYRVSVVSEQGAGVSVDVSTLEGAPTPDSTVGVQQA